MRSEGVEADLSAAADLSVVAVLSAEADLSVAAAVMDTILQAVITGAVIPGADIPGVVIPGVVITEVGMADPIMVDITVRILDGDWDLAWVLASTWIPILIMDTILTALIHTRMNIHLPHHPDIIIRNLTESL